MPRYHSLFASGQDNLAQAISQGEALFAPASFAPRTSPQM